MASTYSTSLRLELMATGDQSGTWGTTTNTNLGTLLEQAITGYLSVAQGDVANLTLTTVNGGSDQARNVIVRVTGALTATRNVVVQTAAKLYTIANDTTGGFSIVAKTSGGTGVSIPPGAMIDVYSDGTNVVAAQNYWSGQIGGAVYLDAGATVGPVMDLFRDSASPAASDILGQVIFNGRDSAANKQEYASIQAVIADSTSTSEDSSLDVYAQTAGARVQIASFGPSAILRGTPTNNDAASGFVGEFISATIAVGSAVSLTSNTTVNITSISLTAGDWDVYGIMCFVAGATTNISYLSGGVSSVSATLPSHEDYSLLSPVGIPITDIGIAVPTIRVSIASTTTYYLVSRNGFSVSTLTGYGALRARRAR